MAKACEMNPAGSRTGNLPVHEFAGANAWMPGIIKNEFGGDLLQQPGDYDRTIAARAFDVTRYLLPLAVRTNVGQVVSIRTLEKQITRLLSSHLPELRAVGEELPRDEAEILRG